MTFPTFCACLAFVGVFLMGVAAIIFALRKRSPDNHDLFQK